MRILAVTTLVSPLGEYGGPLRVAVNHAKALRARGHSVTIAGSYRGFDTAPPDVDGVPARLFRARTPIGGIGHAGLAAPGLVHWMLSSAGEFDVAHVHLARDLVTLPVARIAAFRGLPYIVQTHGMIDRSDRLLSKPLDRLLTTAVLSRARRVLYLTDDERDELVAVAGDRALALSALPNGVPSASPAPADVDPIEVLYLGRLTSRKRPAAFVRMATALGREFRAVRFTLVGPDDGEGEAVRDAIAAAHGTAIAWEGPIAPSAVLDRLQRGSVFVLPAVTEPYPMSVLEAMSVGLPVVVTQSCGLADFVARCDGGLVVGEDDASLIGAVRRLLSDLPAARLCGRRGRAAVRAELSMDSIASRLEVLYTA